MEPEPLPSYQIKLCNVDRLSTKFDDLLKPGSCRVMARLDPLQGFRKQAIKLWFSCKRIIGRGLELAK
jgi:hypothetical protein